MRNSHKLTLYKLQKHFRTCYILENKCQTIATNYFCNMLILGFLATTHKNNLFLGNRWPFQNKTIYLQKLGNVDFNV